MAELDEEVGGQQSGGSGGGSKLIIILLAVNLLVVMGLGVYVIFFSGQNTPPPPQGEEGEAAEGGEEGEDGEKKVIGPVTELEPFLVNLDEPGSSRYLRAVVQLELSDQEVADEVTQREVQLRDLIITYLSSLNYSQTQGVVNKEIIRSTLKKKISGLITKGDVRNLYFTEFVIQ